MILDSFYLNDEQIEDRELFEYLSEKLKDEEGYMYTMYPNIKMLDKPMVQANIFLLTEKYGIISIVIHNVEKVRNDIFLKIDEKADMLDSSIYSTLIKNRGFKKNTRSLMFNIKTIIFLPNCSDNEIEGIKDQTDYEVCNSKNKLLNSICKDTNDNNYKIPNSQMEEILAYLEKSYAVIKPKERLVNTEDISSKAYVLREIETQLSRFDSGQRAAALMNLEGPQRIRGLAGSGKTIVLCMKAALLLLKYPESKILYTFYTKSLYDYIKQLITRFYSNLSDGQMPDFDNSMYVMHAWGGKNVNGVYYFACNDNNVDVITYGEAMRIDGINPFDAVCKDFIKKTRYDANKYFDFILIDEAQDFNPSFYQLCNSIVKNNKLVWGYDELQNIFNVKIQNVHDTFANEFDKKGLSLNDPHTSNRHSDIVLQKSYRNYKNILIWAIACGFGIYNDKLIQSLENNDHWNDLGFNVVKGNCEKQEYVEIVRDDNNSPLKIPDTYQSDDFIKIMSYKTFNEEINGICKEIIRSIKEDGLRADDIIVISIDDRNASAYFRRIAKYLNENDIATYDVVSKNYVKGFQVENAVTLSTVYKAKGNEAAMVFVIGCDVVEKQKNNRNMRNKLFTAFTRAKVWLRITGMEIENHSIVNEFKTLKKNEYIFKFVNTPTSVLERDWKEYTERSEFDKILYGKIEEEAKKYNLSIEEYLRTFILEKEKSDESRKV